MVMLLAVVPGASAATYTVNDGAGNDIDGCGAPGDGDPDDICQYSEAVADAIQTAADDTVFVPAGLNASMYFVPFPINQGGKLTVQGGGTPRPHITGGLGGGALLTHSVPLELNGVEIESAGGFPGSNRPILVSSAALTVKDSVLSGGFATGDGGAITAQATLAVSDTTFEDNSANGFGGAIKLGATATATIERSLFAGNSAGIGGGGIQNSGALTVTNTSFKQNSADDFGGAIDNFDGAGPATAAVNSATFSQNHARVGNGPGDGGGTQSSDEGAFSVTNSIYVGNTVNDGTMTPYADSQCAGLHASGGFNLRSTVEAGCTGFGAGEPIGTAILGAGIESNTIPLLPGSGVNQGGLCPATDGRGLLRAPAAPCDIGAYEIGATAPKPDTGSAPPGPPAGGTSPAMSTGQRAAALKRCAKIRKNKAKKKKCKKKAIKLPL